MHTHGLPALLGLLSLLTLALAGGLLLGTSCANTELLVGRGVPEVPRLSILPGCARPRRNLGRRSPVSRLVGRGKDKRPTSSRTEDEAPEPRNWQINPPNPAFQGPSSSQGPPKRLKVGSSPPGPRPTREPTSSREEVPLDPARNNIPGASRKTRMFQAVTPDPHSTDGVIDPSTGDRIFFRRILDEPEVPRSWDDKFRRLNPIDRSYSVALSEGQKAEYMAYPPGKFQAVRTLGIGGVEEGSRGKWQSITPKKGHELPPGTTEPWAPRDAARNLVQQYQHFKNHEAGQDDSQYGRLDRAMRDMCKTERCSEEVLKRIFRTRPPALRRPRP